jgi:hypothetical protein
MAKRESFEFVIGYLAIRQTDFPEVAGSLADPQYIGIADCTHGFLRFAPALK